MPQKHLHDPAHRGTSVWKLVELARQAGRVGQAFLTSACRGSSVARGNSSCNSFLGTRRHQAAGQRHQLRPAHGRRRRWRVRNISVESAFLEVLEQADNDSVEVDEGMSSLNRARTAPSRPVRAGSRGIRAKATLTSGARPPPGTECRGRSMPNSTTSPGLRYTGGLKPRPTPAGVPVEIMSPGSRRHELAEVVK